MKLSLAYRLRDTVRILSCEIILGLLHNSKQRVLTFSGDCYEIILSLSRYRCHGQILSCEIILGLPHNSKQRVLTFARDSYEIILSISP
jgi:hypothetical protein